MVSRASHPSLPPNLFAVQYETIETETHLAEFCHKLAAAPAIAFDTEFVSEDTYFSDLCLVQVATAEHLAVIDTVKVPNLAPFWNVLADGSHETIVHAGREELVFSLNAVGRRPARLFDVQIAAGLVGFDYPAGYSSLIYHFLGHRPPKGETRTDWRKRPLSKQQLEYALNDVLYLLPVRDRLQQQLKSLGRTEWMAGEMATWQTDIENYRTEPRWRRVSGISGLSNRGLAIVRELWHWREDEARRRNRPPKRVLRDDLIIEMAKRANADPKRIMAVRGMERGLQRYVPEFAGCIERALEDPEEKQSRGPRPDLPAQLTLLGQFLSSALTSICRTANVAPSIVGTASDVRDLIAYRLGIIPAGEEGPPVLARGWRAEIVGKLLDDLLAGRVSIRIQDPLSEEPLAFEPSSNGHAK